MTIPLSGKPASMCSPTTADAGVMAITCGLSLDCSAQWPVDAATNVLNKELVAMSGTANENSSAWPSAFSNGSSVGQAFSMYCTNASKPVLFTITSLGNCERVVAENPQQKSNYRAMCD